MCWVRKRCRVEGKSYNTRLEHHCNKSVDDKVSCDLVLQDNLQFISLDTQTLVPTLIILCLSYQEAVEVPSYSHVR